MKKKIRVGEKMQTVEKSFFGCFMSVFLFSAVAFSSPPEFGLEGLKFESSQNKTVELKAFSKKPLLLVLWATWCEACQEELDLLQKVQLAYADDLQVLAVNVDKDPKAFALFLKDKEFKFEIVRSLFPESDLKKLEAGASVPFTILYDESLSFVASYRGYKPYPHLRALVAPLMAGRRH